MQKTGYGRGAPFARCRGGMFTLPAGYICPKFFSRIAKSEVKVLDQFRLDNGVYPSAGQALAAWGQHHAL